MADSPQYYPGLDSQVLWTSLATYDPLFVCPVLFGLGNYLFLKHYKHPITLHFSERTRLILAFSSSLASVLWPVVYIEAWGAFWLTHYLLHTVAYRQLTK